MPNLSQVKNSGLFLCPKRSQYVPNREAGRPKEKSAGAKDTGVLFYIGGS